MYRLFQTKNVLWLIVLASVGGVLSSLFIQFVLGKQPCNLCILQRIMVVVVGVVALFLVLSLTFVWKKQGSVGKVIVNILASIPTIIGAGVAIQQIYIQSLPPDQVPACGSPLEFMLETMPVADAIQQVLYGSGECAKVETFIWLPIPWWSLAFFSGALIFIWASWFFVGRKSP